MEGDIFATKGAEYLIVIAYLALLVAVRFLAPPRLAHALGARGRHQRAHPIPWFSVREGYHYHQGHAWVHEAHGPVLTVGLDEFAARLLGAPDRVALPAVGTTIHQGERGWTVEAGERVLPMLSPVEGEVVEVNRAVLETPTLASHDPYGEGWLLKVRAANPRATLSNLLSGELAGAWIRHTVERLRRLPAAGLGPVMADGGVPVHGFGHAVGPEEWHTVAREFFLTE